MALKRLKTKKSKRLTGKLKHKIEKKVREHNRKVRRESKRNPKQGSKKQKLIQIPNVCPFKDEILKDVEEVKKRQDEERKQRRELSKTENKAKGIKTLEGLREEADIRDILHSSVFDSGTSEKLYKTESSKEQSLKQYVREFRKVIDNSDVVLEVVDARDPLGTRCPEVESLVRSLPGNKRLVLVLNKADLVPKDNLKKWIAYFRRSGPVTAFKASTQDQTSRFGYRKLREMKSERAMQGSVCIGAELLMSMLGNYCRNKGIKTSIRVGIVGIPNVGKSSIINSLSRGKTCNVGSTPGVTKAMQEVELDSKIKLIDCPGIVFTSSKKETDTVLKNAQRVSDVKDPFTVAESVLKRASKEYFCKLYDVTNYDSYEEFFAKKASRMGKFLKKGIPDVSAAARSVLHDWNTGKIKYCTQPPELPSLDNVHVGASIVTNEFSEFDVNNFEAIEADILNKFEVKPEDVMVVTSSEPLEMNTDVEQPIVHTVINETDIKTKSRKRKIEPCLEKKETDPSLLLGENQSLNKSIKEIQKRKKKQNSRNEKKMAKITDVLDNFTISSTSKKNSYDFDEDFNE